MSWLRDLLLGSAVIIYVAFNLFSYPWIFPRNRFQARDRNASTRALNRILFWTTYFGDPPIENGTIVVNGWEITTNRSLLESSLIVIFHGRDISTRISNGSKVLPSGMPLPRYPHQLWVFYLLESPVHTHADLKAFKGVFNLTATYRKSSHIYTPYGQLIPHVRSGNATANISLTIQRKTKLVSWLVSNCHTQSGRNALVEQLQDFIQVDVYGGCGKLSCPKNQSCLGYLGENYKFYLSFENSLCEDYVTEKFFNALQHGLVPIVYGGANYTQLAPSGSYINVRDFESAEDLADYLNFLDKNPAEYLKYFKWRESFSVKVNKGFASLFYSLCAFGRRQNGEAYFVPDVHEFWNGKDNASTCHNPDLWKEN